MEAYLSKRAMETPAKGKKRLILPSCFTQEKMFQNFMRRTENKIEVSESTFKSIFRETYKHTIKYGGKTDYCVDCFHFKRDIRWAKT